MKIKLSTILLDTIFPFAIMEVVANNELTMNYKDTQRRDQSLWDFHSKYPQFSVLQLARIFHLDKSGVSRKLKRERTKRGFILKSKHINSWMK